MIDDDFYRLLEYKICEVLKNSPDKEVKRFWCDGVTSGQEHQYSGKYVNDNRKILMTAYIGETGQDKYNLTLNFGSKALSRYARGLAIAACIPESPADEWFEIDVLTRQIWIQLN